MRSDPEICGDCGQWAENCVCEQLSLRFYCNGCGRWVETCTCTRRPTSEKWLREEIPDEFGGFVRYTRISR